MAEVPELLRAALSGRYDVQRELGRGGMATVYLAVDVRLRRGVAIKVLNAEMAASVGRPRFLREIEIATRLNHPHILPLLDSGEAGGLLYYVMPYVEGESLKDRLVREKQLPVSDAVAITRDVADGLDHAHAQGVVHRDIKPGNILLFGGSAVVADFGIARAVRRSATDDTLTDVSLAIGTPPYMSPEQWSGTRELDARSDVYSLGCVAYEMLAGEPPFSGPTTEAIAARTAFDPVPPLRTVRPRVSTALERAILTALEKVPADRFGSAGAFATALAEAPLEPEEREAAWAAWLRRAALAGGALAAAVVVWMVGRDLWPQPGTSADTTRYVILPFRYEEGATPGDEADRLRDALGRWSGISLVDPFQVQEAIGRRDGPGLSASDALKTAQRLKAGRYLRADVSRRGDSVLVRGFLYDATAGGAILGDGAIELGPAGAGAGAAFRTLADSLLLHGAELPPLRHGTGTLSLPARQAYARGHRAIEEWDLAAADSAFAAATRYDERYAQAFLWLAQVRAWNRAPPATWRSAAERSAARRDQLPPDERWQSDALVALSEGDFERACALWHQVTDRGPTDFTGWYSLASCLSADNAVIPDARSPTGWRFRTSYHRAVIAYQRAFQLLPAIHKALRADSYASVRRLLKTGSTDLRVGHALPPDTTVFLAYPSRSGDSLAFVPHPRDEFQRPQSRVVPPTRELAVRRQRELFHDIALGWAIAFPRSADAMLALAVSLDLLGNASALDSLRAARVLTTTPEEHVRVAASQVWALLKYALPADTAGVRAAAVLADSLLRGPPAGVPHPGLLAGLAALTGRATLASELSRRAHTLDPWSWSVPPPLARAAPALLVFSALGGPRDSIRVLEQRVDSAISGELPEGQRDAARREWLARSASLAFPAVRFRSLGSLPAPSHPIAEAQMAVVAGDTARALDILGRLRVTRRAIPPADLTFDALYPEAALLAALGDTAAAIAWLDPSLTSLRTAATQTLAEVPVAAALVRAMALRAELAAATGDAEGTRRWARPVLMLWSHADEFLRPHVEHMKALVAEEAIAGLSSRVPLPR